MTICNSFSVLILYICPSKLRVDDYGKTANDKEGRTE